MWYFSSPEWANKIALIQQDKQLTYQELANAVSARKNWLLAQQVSRVAIAMDNTIEWVLFDLACQAAELCCVPVPSFFSQQQTAHLLNESGIELMLTQDNNSPANHDATDSPFDGVFITRLVVQNEPEIPIGTHKITFTSGTTGQPKGVCLSNEAQLNVTRSIADTVALEEVRHLCLLPLATLLENIAGVYSPLLVGGTIILASQEERGFSGSRLAQPQQLLTLISQQQPTSLILVPELLSLFVGACLQGWKPPTSLRFIAVGGGKVAAGLVQKAHALGLPVYQGYGLSECASVVSLNTPAQQDQASAGAVLPHNQLHIEQDELVITGNLFLGYLNQPESFYPQEVRTGDLVSLNNGFLSIDGRQKNIIINSFGRNLSPEWVEAEIMATGYFRETLVFGEAKPHCGALLSPAVANITEEQIQQVISMVNQHLPDYATIGTWLALAQPLRSIPGMVTATGKPIRDKILAHFSDQIESLYTDTFSPLSTASGATL
ncbi:MULTISPECIES: AMP-binding protein [Marinomonas]|uniref:AMP-binding protein n=1 Tax=Marinomonas arctica TaxID=383750 RepID=A0A7H1J8E3_9GAMM|nr:MULTISPECIES: AMP-binding protein [Marinomonas]MCS7487648.1 AMP-dependent synthetase [Marinomonas sp. BSi20414]QNT06759.1 AMP-binding protein [Marinomonas arctica]GGN23304.1 long-chain acyl-CoA synthetase [Marinomonas arctica]